MSISKTGYVPLQHFKNIYKFTFREDIQFQLQECPPDAGRFGKNAYSTIY